MIRVEEQLKKLIEDLYVAIHEGQQTETRNTELKREWYNLSKAVKGDEYKINVSKFIKEITAMANNYGPWAGHLIIGLGEDGKIIDSPLIKSGLKDETDLYNLVVSTVDKPIRFECYEVLTNIDGENKTVFIILVPVSIDKPHVMYEYVTEKQRQQNYIPVKKGTAIYPASRSDLDLMLYDKQNIVLEYALDIIPVGNYYISKAGASVQIELPVIFENFGRKPIILTTGHLIILPDESQGRVEEIRFFFSAYRLINGQTVDFKAQPIIVPNKNAATFPCFFSSWDVLTLEDFQHVNFDYYIKATDAVGNTYESKKISRIII